MAVRRRAAGRDRIAGRRQLPERLLRRHPGRRHPRAGRPAQARGDGSRLATSVLAAALVAIGVAGFAGLALALATAPVLILFVGALALIAAFAYSGGPRPYAGLGLGEVMVFLFFGLMATCGTAFVMTESVPASAWWCGAVLGFLAVAILLANNLRDIPTDATTGKRTLAVRLGEARTRFLYRACVVAAFGTIVVGVVTFIPMADRPSHAVGTAGARRVDPGDPPDGGRRRGDRPRAGSRPERDGGRACGDRSPAGARTRPRSDGLTERPERKIEMEQADISLACATALVDGLIGGGVVHACVSPGSRSTPLALALARDPRVAVYVQLDERSSGFFALGIAKATGRPAIVATTSGTAAAELFPAVVEASQSRVPLVVLTADRPPRVRGTGANQTIVQPDLYGGYVKGSIDLPVPSDRRPRGMVAPGGPRGAPDDGRRPDRPGAPELSLRGAAHPVVRDPRPPRRRAVHVAGPSGGGAGPRRGRPARPARVGHPGCGRVRRQAGASRARGTSGPNCWAGPSSPSPPRARAGRDRRSRRVRR